ncbi:MAG: hypothetical protein AAFO63_07370, partial [Pseudomonadota bacterium]
MALLQTSFLWALRGLAAGMIAWSAFSFSAEAQLYCPEVGGPTEFGDPLRGLQIDFDRSVPRCEDIEDNLAKYNEPHTVGSSDDFSVLLPSDGELPASLYPAKLYFGDFTTGGATYNVIDTLSCPGAVISGIGVAAPATIELA